MKDALVDAIDHEVVVNMINTQLLVAALLLSFVVTLHVGTNDLLEQARLLLHLSLREVRMHHRILGVVVRELAARAASGAAGPGEGARLRSLRAPPSHAAHTSPVPLQGALSTPGRAHRLWRAGGRSSPRWSAPSA